MAAARAAQTCEWRTSATLRVAMAYSSLPVKGGICLGDTVRMPLWRFRESSLDEVLIERKGRADAQSPHHNEGNTIRERVIFIVMLLEIRHAS